VGPAVITMIEAQYSSSDVCRLTGVTYRVLDYWARCDVITPELRDANGSGSRRSWSWRQIEWIDVMWRVHEYLVQYVGDRGVSTDIMHSLATALAEHRPWLMGASVDEEGTLTFGGMF
jgi:hypothetical protein